MEQRLELIYINKERLTKLKNNPRKLIDAEGKAKLAKLIKEHGFQSPLQIWKDGEQYVILCGNHRYDAGIEIGMTEFPCVEYKGTKEMAIARAISDNKSNEFTTWADEELKKIMQDLNEIDFDMSLTAFDFEEINEMLGLEDDKVEPEDVAPEVVMDKPAVTQMGDLWTLGKHRLLCGDATNQNDVNRLMNGTKASMIFTDPPYGMNLKTDFTLMSEVTRNRKNVSAMSKEIGNGAVSKNYDRVIGDDKDYDPSHIFRDFGYCKEIFLWGADYYAERLQDKNKGSWFIWDKRADIEDVEFSLSEFETCWSKNKHHRKLLRYRWFGVMGLEQKEEDSKSRVHPNQKPVKMFLWFIENYSEENDIVADPFLGSGSTLITCEKANRICYGMEIFPQYCDVILKRWADYTGEDPVRHDGKKWSELYEQDGQAARLWSELIGE